MILPIGHEEREVRRLPWVTFGIMIACTLIFLGTDIPVAEFQLEGEAEEFAAASEMPQNAFTRWGLTPSEPRALTFLTHMFLHGGWLHLIGNLFMFFLAAPALEDRLGRPLFAGFYVLAGLFAGVLHLAMNTESTLPMVGASGAIAGVLGAFCVRFWTTRIRFLYFFLFAFRPITGTFQAPAWLMLPLWFGSELLQAGLSSHLGIETGVAYWAHVGGFAFGAAVAAGAGALRIEERYLHDAIESKVTFLSANPALELAMGARERGDLDEAYTTLERAVRADPGDADLALAFWDVAAASERASEGAPAMAGVVRHAAASGDLDAAARYWIEMTSQAPGALADPATLLRLAPSLRERGQEREALRALRHAVDPRNSGLTPGVAMRVMDQARPIDAATALMAAQRVLEFTDLDETKRARIGQTVAELEAQGVAPPSADELAGVSNESTQEAVQQGRALDVDWDEASAQAERDAASARDDEDLPAMRVELSAEGDLSAADSNEDLAGSAVAPPQPPPLPLPAAAIAPPPLPAASAGSAGRPEMPTPPRIPETPEDDDALGDVALDDLVVALARFSDIKVIDATPQALSETELSLRTADGRSARLALDRIEAVGVAAVDGLGPKPVVVIDLALNWSSVAEEPLRVVRLRSDRFDPRRLTSRDTDALASLRAFLAALLDASAAVPLPDANAARGRPFHRSADLAIHQREVLSVAV